MINIALGQRCQKAEFWGFWNPGLPIESITLSLPQQIMLWNGKTYASSPLGAGYRHWFSFFEFHYI